MGDRDGGRRLVSSDPDARPDARRRQLADLRRLADDPVGSQDVARDGRGAHHARLPPVQLTMRQLSVIEFVTLDGVMQGLGSPDEDRDGGFEHGGWAAPYGDQIQQAAALEGMQTTTAYLFGRRTYDKM